MIFFNFSWIFEKVSVVLQNQTKYMICHLHQKQIKFLTGLSMIII